MPNPSFAKWNSFAVGPANVFDSLGYAPLARDSSGGPLDAAHMVGGLKQLSVCAAACATMDSRTPNGMWR